MDIDNILKIANSFYSLASDSNKLKEILEKISSLDTFEDRINMAEKKLERLSSGSSRIVFLTPEKTVLKLAKNNKGIAQNKEELKIGGKSKYVNKILSSDKNFLWLEVPFLDKINEKDFKEMTNFIFEDFGDSIKYQLSKSSKKKPKDFDSICKDPLFKDLINLIKKFKLMPGDIVRISSWGVKDNCPILIDTGLTSKVYSEFYKSSKSSKSS
jgi:hypothetical protein